MREEEEEEEKKKRREEESQAKKVWKLTLIMDSMRLCMTFHACMINSLSPNLGFCYGFILTQNLWKVRWVKSHMAQDGYGIPLLDWIHG